MKTPLPKFPHHRGVPEHHFGVKTPLLATLAALFLHSKQHQDLERDMADCDCSQMLSENAILQILH